MKDLIILGKGDSSKHCPFDTEVWGVNDVYLKPECKGKKIDKLFAFDPLGDGYVTGMKLVAPVVSWQSYADEKYPLNEILEEFKSKYFPNTICYMLALAIYQRYEKLRLYGIDQPSGSQYAIDKSGVEYWLGRAQGRGIEVVVSQGSCLLETVTGLMYGEVGAKDMMLYLWERFALMGLLPAKGNAYLVNIASQAQALLGFTKREIDDFGIKAILVGNGQATFSWEKEDAERFTLSKEVCGIIKKSLIKLHKKEGLPLIYNSLYEKFVLVE